MSEIQKAIQEQIAKRRLNILKGVISANGDNEEDKTEYESVSEAEGELFNDQASISINKVSDDGYKEIKKAQTIILEASVGIVVNDFGQILLGLAISDDERDGNWCFPGGGIDDGENSLNAAIREVYEEMGLICEPLQVIHLYHPTKPKVAFHILKSKTTEINFNEEFQDARWFNIGEPLPENILPLNLEILKILS